METVFNKVAESVRKLTLRDEIVFRIVIEECRSIVFEAVRVDYRRHLLCLFSSHVRLIWENDKKPVRYVINAVINRKLDRASYEILRLDMTVKMEWILSKSQISVIVRDAYILLESVLICDFHLSHPAKC